jgi:hypothetical protein
MQKKIVTTLAAALLLAAAVPSAHAGFTIGGTNGWTFSTDGFLNAFATYETIEERPDLVIGGTLGGDQTGTGERQQQFRIRTGLLPVGIGLNINSPTYEGVNYGVRLGIYPQIQNEETTRTDISPNIDFREIYFTADGSFGQVLVGRAINLYQAKNILTDMTLFGAGVVGPVNNGPTMGHIGYGYLYPNFGAQMRYTTPSLSGVKVAVSVNDTNRIGEATIRNVPRLETEISYATDLSGAKVSTWVSGLYQRASFSEEVGPEQGGHATSAGGAAGVQVGVAGAEVLASGYYGQALGMLGMQGDDAMSVTGDERTHWGFLTQATYKLTEKWKVGVNYGQSRAELADGDTSLNIMKQQAAVAALTYNVNPFVQVIGEVTWAQDRWFNGATQDGHMGALGTFIYW